MNYAYDARGNRVSMTDPNLHTTGYEYDALSRLVTVTDPLTLTVAYTYDPNGKFEGLGVGVTGAVSPIQDAMRAPQAPAQLTRIGAS